MDHYQWFKDGKGNRDPIFEEILGLLNKKPANILEIGTMRSIDERSSGGASTFFWAEYIKSFGGKLHICDASSESLDFSGGALKEFYDKAIFHLNYGINVIKKLAIEWDIVYLDGSNDPREMLEEYEACKAKYILCDDFFTKGVLLRNKYPNFRLYKWRSSNHELALFGVNTETIYLEPIT